jgi:hypothetical protein
MECTHWPLSTKRLCMSCEKSWEFLLVFEVARSYHLTFDKYHKPKTGESVYTAYFLGYIELSDSLCDDIRYGI